MGLFRDNETNNLNGTDHGCKSQLARGKSVGYFTSMPMIWTRDYREQIQLQVRAGLEHGASELQVQRSNHSATLPPVYIGCSVKWIKEFRILCRSRLLTSSKLHRADTKVVKSLSTDLVLTNNEVRYYLPAITIYFSLFSFENVRTRPTIRPHRKLRPFNIIEK